MMVTMPTRQPVVPLRRVALGDEAKERQIARGLFTVQGGERIPIPTPARTKLWVVTDGKVHRPGVRFSNGSTDLHRRVLTWARDHVHRNIPRLYYQAVLGHDLHVSTWGDLYGRQWHAGWANPFNPEQRDLPLDPTFHTLRLTHFVDHECDLPACPRDVWGSWEACLAALSSQWGFVEDLGWLSGNKVTDAFVSEEIDELVSATGTEYADFDYHEVGTSTQAESNNDTALIATSGIARATGTPTDSDPIYQNVGTITADATETWEEHGLFNNTSGAALMDRSLTGGQAVASSDSVEYTFSLTKNPEA